MTFDPGSSYRLRLYAVSSLLFVVNLSLKWSPSSHVALHLKVNLANGGMTHRKAFLFAPPRTGTYSKHIFI